MSCSLWDFSSLTRDRSLVLSCESGVATTGLPGYSQQLFNINAFYVPGNYFQCWRCKLGAEKNVKHEEHGERVVRNNIGRDLLSTL